MGERLTDDEIDEALQIAKSLSSLRLTAAVAELKERRAADLTSEDVEVLRWLYTQAHAIGYDRAKRGREDLHTRRALAVLDRLLNGGE